MRASIRAACTVLLIPDMPLVFSCDAGIAGAAAPAIHANLSGQGEDAWPTSSNRFP